MNMYQYRRSFHIIHGFTLNQKNLNTKVRIENTINTVEFFFCFIKYGKTYYDL